MLENGKFVFRVCFENLRDWELGLLILTLSGLGEAVKLGHARAYGFGTVKPKVTVIQLYEKEKGTFRLVEDGTEYVEAGLKKLKEWFGKKGMEEHLRKLQNVLGFQEELKIGYPEEGFEKYEALKGK